MDLTTRISALPQELQDEILLVTLLATLPRGKILCLDRSRGAYSVSALIPPVLPSGCPICGVQHYRVDFYRKSRKDGEVVYEVVPDLEVPAQGIVPITRNYKPPIALQIDRRTRRAMSQIHYSSTIFFLLVPPLWGSDASMWDDRLCREHRKLARLLVDSRNLPPPPQPLYTRRERPGDMWIESTWTGDQGDLRVPGRWATQEDKDALDVNIQALPQTVQDRLLHFTLLSTMPVKKKLTWTQGLNGSEWEVCRIDRYNRTQVRYSTNGFGRGGEHEDAMVVPIDLRHKPPVALQINHKTREDMAEVFYGDMLFYTDSEMSLGLDEWHVETVQEPDDRRLRRQHLGRWNLARTNAEDNRRIDSKKGTYHRRKARSNWMDSVPPAYRWMVRVLCPRSTRLDEHPQRFLDGKTMGSC